MKKIVLLTFAFLLTSCATTANYEALLNTWLNNDINSLINSWGYPSDSFVAPNGNKVYVYQYGGSFTTPTYYQTNANVYGYGNYAYGNATTTVYGGQTVTLWCRTFFEVNSSNRIIRWSWQGNNCKSQYHPQTEPEQTKNYYQPQKTEPIAQVFNNPSIKESKVSECDEQKARSVFNSKYDNGDETGRYTYKTHYSSKRNKCFMYVQRVSSTSTPDKEEIRDINEDKYYGMFRIAKDTVVCVIKDRSCKSKEQWDAYVKEMMAE